MMDTQHHAYPKNIQSNLVKLYWVMRFGIAFIWLWTAIVSWCIYPRTESLDWLHRLGLVHHTFFVFAGACCLDMVMGIASCIFASRRVWQLQFMIVVSYSFVIAIWLPEFLMHPFGPITKNIAVLACLAYLSIVEKR